MSHFVVAVFTQEGDKMLEELLEPYKENNVESCPEQYLCFKDVEDDELNTYKNGTIDMIRRNGKLIRPGIVDKCEGETIEKINFPKIRIRTDMVTGTIQMLNGIGMKLVEDGQEC